MERQQQRMIEETERQNKLEREVYPSENVNKKLQDCEVASSVEGILNALDGD